MLSLKNKPFSTPYKQQLWHYGLIFLGFFSITFLLYLPALHSKFVFDFLNMIFDSRKQPGIFDLSNGIRFDFVSLFVFKSWLHLFGFNAWAWHVLQCFLHALNAVLLNGFLGLVLRHFQYYHWNRISLLATLCFLLNPYQTEPLIWGGDLNYLLVGCFIFLNLLAYALFLQTRKNKYLVTAVGALMAGAFCHELGWFILPADLILTIALAPSVQEVFSKSTIKYWLISCAAMGFYFANKVISGNLLGHYGAAVHLRFKLTEIVPVFYQYLIKILLHGNFFPKNYAGKLYGIIAQPKIAYLLTAVILVGAILLFRLIKKHPALKAPACFFILFALFVFPVLNLYFPFWIKIQGDRYCYVTSAFLLASAITVLFGVRPLLGQLFASVYLICAVYFLTFNIQSWHYAGDIAMQLEKDYRWPNAPHTYILNLPDNYRGAYMYRSKQPSTFAASFIKYGDTTLNRSKITEVLGYNLNTPTDSVTVQVTAPDELNVTLSTWGGWWWRDSRGATDYEDSLVAVHIDEWNHAYKVRFRQKHPGDVFIYCANGHWTQVQNF